MPRGDRKYRLAGVLALLLGQVAAAQDTLSLAGAINLISINAQALADHADDLPFDSLLAQSIEVRTRVAQLPAFMPLATPTVQDLLVRLDAHAADLQQAANAQARDLVGSLAQDLRDDLNRLRSALGLPL